MTSADGALIQLKAWLSQSNLPKDGRLPPEREFADLLGVSRGDLRKALATLEKMENCGEELVRELFLVRNQLTNYLLLVGLLKNPTRWK